MNNWTARPAALAIAASLCAGCAGTGSNACPPLIDYTREFARALALEVEAMGADMVTPDAIADYLVLRDQVRACRQEGP
jgi:hypothetical protein